MSLTLQSDTEAQAAAPSRRSTLHPVVPLAARSPEASVAPVATLIVPGWYADPMGSPLSRWWDGNAWTAKLSAEVATEPAAAVVETVSEVPVGGAPVADVPAVDVRAVDPTELPLSGAPAAAPLSRRQLRELVGPLTTGPVQIDTPVAAAPFESPAPVESTVPFESILAASATPPLLSIVPGTETAGTETAGTETASTETASTETADTESGARSPFEALFESTPAERESAESAVFDATAFLDPTDVTDSSVARPWIGAAAPLAPATSALAPIPVPVQPAPPVPVAATAEPFAFDLAAPVGEPVIMPAVPATPAPAFSAPTFSAPNFAAPTFSSGSLGFTLPPDPFATPSAALQAAPPAFVSIPTVSGTVAASVSPTLAVSARSTTAAVWLFTFLPVVHVTLAWFVLSWLDLGSDLVVRYSVLGAPLFLYLVLAFADRRVLLSRGFERTAPTVLALVPLLYLVVRAIRVGTAALVPLLLWLLLQTAAYAFLLLQLPAIFALVPLTPTAAAAPVSVVSGPITDAQRVSELTPTGMAAELTRQTLAKNLTFSSISCPAIPVTLDGTAVSCVGTLASVKMNLNVVIDSSLPNSAFALVSEAPAV